MLKFCSCKACKVGRRKPRAKCITRLVIRANRREAKLALRKGNECINFSSVPLTD